MASTNTVSRPEEPFWLTIKINFASMKAISINMSNEAREKVLLTFLKNLDFLKVKPKKEIKEISAREEHEELKQIVLSRKNPAFLKHID